MIVTGSVVAGSGFTGTSRVDFGAVPASSFTVLSDDAIQAVAPPGTGTVPVTVYGGGAPAGGSVVGQYTYVAVQSVAPASGPPAGGTWVVIDGTGLGSATTVLFGQTAAPFYPLSDTQIEALSPPGTGTQEITVDTLYGGNTPTTSADQFTYGTSSSGAARTAVVRRGPSLAASAPSAGAAASGALPASGPLGGASVSPFAPALPDGVTATGLAAQVLQFVYQNGPHLLGGLSAIKNQIQAILAAQSGSCEGSHEAVAHLLNVAATPLVELAVDEALPSVLAAETAALWETGPALLVIYAVTPVALNYVAEQLADALIDAAVGAYFGECPKEDTPTPPIPPPTPGGGGGDGGGGGGFVPNALVDPSGTVFDTNGNPISGATATILRSDVLAGPFAPVDVTQPGIEPAVNPETTDSGGTFHWDVDAGFYEVQATAPGCSMPGDPGQSAATIGPYPVPPPQLGLAISLACPSEAPAPVPSVTSLSQSTGPAGGGTTVMVLGSGFTPSSQVRFAGTPAQAVTFLSPQALTVVSPAGSGPADVVVHTAGGDSATSAADHFFFGAPPTVTGLSVQQGPAAGGTSITITGSGFTGATLVGFGGAPGNSLVVKSDTEIQVTAPLQIPGTMDVEVVTPAGASAPSAADQYTFLPAAPVCGPVSLTVPAGTATPVTLSCTGQSVVYDQPASPAHGTLTGLDSTTGAVTYTPNAGYAGPDSFTYTAHNAGGPSNPATVTLAVIAPPSVMPTVAGPTAAPTSAAGSQSTATITGGVGPVSVGAGAPRAVAALVTGLNETASRWVEARAGRARSKIAVGTTFGFTLNEAAIVQLRFTQTTTGRTAGKRCVAVTSRHGKKPKRCRLIRVVGTFSVSGAAGANRVSFRGMLAGQRLAPGRYTLHLTATAAGTTSSPQALSFVIAS